jgi:hypothetical protein
MVSEPAASEQVVSEPAVLARALASEQVVSEPAVLAQVA